MNAQGLPSFASSAAAGGVIGVSGAIGEDAVAMDFPTALAALRPFLFKRALYLARGRDLAEDLVQTGFSYEEVATLLGQTLGTVKSRVSRARIALLEAMQSHGRAGRRLVPASRQAFETWLADLEGMRSVACAALAHRGAQERPSLPPVRRVALKTDA